MKKWLSQQVDIEIYRDLSSYGHHIRVLFFKRCMADFVIKEGSTEIKRIIN